MLGYKDLKKVEVDRNDCQRWYENSMRENRNIISLCTLYFNTSGRMKIDNTDRMASGNQRIKLLVDSSRDAGITSILFPASIAVLILLFINKNYSVIDIFAISVFYLAFAILLLQNRTTVEVTPKYNCP